MNILTFDIEDWFHILDNPRTQTESDWSKFDSRIYKGMQQIYDILEKTNESDATFFVLGWIAEKYPEVVREIVERGYEVGSHTHLHQLVYNQDQKTFHQDVERSIKTLEDCTGKKVVSFRAPGFSITSKNKWAFEVLHDLGIQIDSSVFPAGRAHGGFPEYGRDQPSILSYEGITLKEFPINTNNFLGRPVIFSGGGYFRVFPYYMIKQWTQQSNYIMTYFHPRDFDYKQPMVPGLSLTRKFKSYVGLKGCKMKLQRFLIDFEFMDIKKAASIINWNECPVIKI